MPTNKPLEQDDYASNGIPYFHALYIPIFSIGLGQTLWVLQRTFFGSYQVFDVSCPLTTLFCTGLARPPCHRGARQKGLPLS